MTILLRRSIFFARLEQEREGIQGRQGKELGSKRGHMHEYACMLLRSGHPALSPSFPIPTTSNPRALSQHERNKYITRISRGKHQIDRLKHLPLKRAGVLIDRSSP